VLSVAPVVVLCAAIRVGAFEAAGLSSLLELPDASVSIVRRVSVYVGRRFKYLPRSGTKREFWTFVRVDSVATSGSESDQLGIPIHHKKITYQQDLANQPDSDHIPRLLEMALLFGLPDLALPVSKISWE
jgi:hypothetical protein